LNQPAEAKECEQKLRGVLEIKVLSQTAQLRQQKDRPADAAAALFARAKTYQRLGRFDEALADLADSAQLDPSKWEPWTIMGYLQLYLGREQDYLATRREVVRRFEKSTDDRTAGLCLVYPGGPEDSQQVMKMIDAAIATHKDAFGLQFFQVSKGMAEYRAGNDQEAVEWLTRGRDEWTSYLASHTRDDRNRYIWDEVLAKTNYFLAMAELRRGREDEARAALAKARAQMEDHVPQADSGSIKVAMEGWLLVQIVAREAEAVVGGKVPDSPPSTGPAGAVRVAELSETRPAGGAAGAASRPVATTLPASASTPQR
jgi:tetratricopeptide (TPR) repeat protein